MSTDYHQLYLNDTATLAKTVVIKSQTAIDLINSLVMLQHGSAAVDANDPTTWKYYKNICGQYHETDQMMRVTSLDTLEDIDFTRENLAIHTATAAAYAYGNRYYYALLNQYPSQEQLILGILYPADMTTAVAADDGAILSYPTGLVEAQEITLMDELQDWIQRYQVRWNVQAFAISDPLYPVAQHAILYLQLIPKLFNLRLKRCKTNEAHSFHIRSYLASHCGLDKYYEYMTLKQALFLYRNIDYIEHHSGKTETFAWLMQKILTDRRIPLAEYQLRLEGSFTPTYHANYRMKKVPLNTEFNTPNQDYYTLTELLAKEEPLAVGNADYTEFNAATIDDKLRNSLSSVLKTKDLESSMTDYSGDQITPLADVLFNHWGWLSANKMYRVAIRFKDPRTSDIVTMYSDDAFIYWIYILSKGLGMPLERVPTYLLTRVQKLKTPSVSELLSYVDRTVIQDDTLALWLIGHQPFISNRLSVSSFYTLCERIYEASLAQWYLTSRTEHMFERALVENMVDSFYQDVEVTFADTGKLYSDWLHSVSLPDTDYSVVECQELMKNILAAATGYTLDPTKVIGNIQKAMLAIMSQLSSYSIQFIQEINTDPIRPLGWAAIRVGNTDVTLNADQFADQESLVLSLSGSQTDIQAFEVSPVRAQAPIVSDQHHLLQSYQHVSYTPVHQIDLVQPVIFAPFQLKASYVGYDPAISDSSGFIGFEAFAALSLAQQATVKDVYGTTTIVPSDPSAVTPIEDAIIFNTLDPVTYVPLSSTFLDTSE